MTKRKKVLLVNCSPKHYNLGLRKLGNYLSRSGADVDFFPDSRGKGLGPLLLPRVDYDAVYLSAIFSWNVPMARSIAFYYQDDCPIYAGGPGFATLSKWWQKETGLGPPYVGVDYTFEYERGDYVMTFASRGCPVGCYFCVVPIIEGRQFYMDWNFQPAPILCDNNLSALPVEFQQHIVNTYQQTKTKLVDANSGFEPRTFDSDTFNRWRPILRGPWRMAYDTTSEGEYVERAMQVLSPIRRYSSKMIYCLIGNEPIAACWKRAISIINWGGCPYVQPMIPLNALSERAYKIAYDWTPIHLAAFARYFNRYLWRIMPLTEYQHSKKVGVLDWPDEIHSIQPTHLIEKYKQRSGNQVSQSSAQPQLL